VNISVFGDFTADSVALRLSRNALFAARSYETQGHTHYVNGCFNVFLIIIIFFFHFADFGVSARRGRFGPAPRYELGDREFPEKE
jgi:hypothetical protein